MPRPDTTQARRVEDTSSPLPTVDEGHEMTSQPDELLTSVEVANAFRVDPATVKRWARTGRLTSILTPGGHRRYKTSEINRRLSGFETAAELLLTPAEMYDAILNATSPIYLSDAETRAVLCWLADAQPDATAEAIDQCREERECETAEAS